MTQQSVNVSHVVPLDVPDGIYPKVAPEDYFAWRGRISPSALEHAVGGTFAHTKAYLDGKIKFTSDAVEFGSALHCRLLEPDRYKTAFAVAQQCEANTKEKKRCSKMGVKFQTENVVGRWLCSTHCGEARSEVTPLTQNEADTISGMGMRIFGHPAVKLLRQFGGCEVSVAWTDKATGIKNQTRLDKWIPKSDFGATILDIKTMRSCNMRAISAAMEDYGWARAAAMRLNAIETLTGERPNYFLICQEKTQPYEVAVVSIGEKTMEGAIAEVADLMSAWAVCVKTDTYPGYSTDFIEVDAPDYKLKQYRETAKIRMPK